MYAHQLPAEIYVLERVYKYYNNNVSHWISFRGHVELYNLLAPRFVEIAAAAACTPAAQYLIGSRM